MATFGPISPGLPSDIPTSPNLPQFTWTGGTFPVPVVTFAPITPLPSTFGSGAFAMGLAPLVLPFLALLSWWFK